MKCWYVVHTQMRSEHLAKRNLDNQGFEAYLPVYSKPRSHARKVDYVTTPLFPRYLFVALDLDLQQWRSINGTLGVSHILTQNSQPVPVPTGIIEEIQTRQDPQGLIKLIRPTYAPGDKVVIKEGAFSEQIGLLESVTDKDRVILLLNLLGREVRVRVNQENIVAAT